jgi:stearoyl-CoA desaturase (delta-9 desaturase)
VLIFFLVHWYLALFCQTFYLHRYAAHQMFTMNKFWERYFGFLTYVTQGASYLSPRAYAILHRMHHAYSDTEQDPHSPVHAKNIWHMMWKTKDIYVGVLKRRIPTPPRFDMHYPSWEMLEKLGESWVSRIAWGTFYTLLYIAAYVYMGMPWYLFALLPVHFFMGPIHGAIVNWSGHKYGYSNFDNNDNSKNSLIADVVMLGELFQNNHHKLPNRLNFAVKWYEFDPVYPIIRLFHFIGILRINEKSLH